MESSLHSAHLHWASSFWRVFLLSATLLATSAALGGAQPATISDASEFLSLRLTVDGSAGSPSPSCCALAASGGLAVVGDRGGVGPGSVLLFERDRARGGWHDAVPIVAEHPQPTDRFGAAVAVDAELVLVGSPGRGAAYVFSFDRLTQTWRQEAELLPQDGSAGAEFGFAVSLHGQQAAIGAPAANSGSGASGAVYLFRRDPQARSWRLEQRLHPALPLPGMAFGAAVAIAGDSVVVGAPLDQGPGGESGSAHAFRRRSDSGAWEEEERLLAADGSSGDGFGYSVALQGRTVLVGAPGGDGGAAGPGYVFVRESHGLWRQEARLSATPPTRARGLGMAVALRGERALLGALAGKALFRLESDGRWREEVSGDRENEIEGGAAVSLAGNRLFALAALDGDQAPGAVRVTKAGEAVDASCSWTAAVSSA